MKVKPVDPAAVIRDPHTKRHLPADGGEVPENSFWTRRWMDGEIWRRVGDVWERRLPSGQVVSAADVGATATAPTGREPLVPLTTRNGR